MLQLAARPRQILRIHVYKEGQLEVGEFKQQEHRGRVLPVGDAPRVDEPLQRRCGFKPLTVDAGGLEAVLQFGFQRTVARAGAEKVEPVWRTALMPAQPFGERSRRVADFDEPGVLALQDGVVAPVDGGDPQRVF